jgi:molecular chaperone GrpE
MSGDQAMTPDTDGAEAHVDGGATDGVLASDAAAVDAAAAEIDAELAALLAERDQFREHALRLQADFENFRKRADRQRVDEVDRAVGKLVEELLPILDACELGYAHGVHGIEGVWSGLLAALRKHGLDPMDATNAAFDPALHEAVVHEAADDPAAGPVVSEVLRTGYVWKGKVLRPAMVKVTG